jgi:MFS family permease
MGQSRHFVTTTALMVALGGFLMGFDAPVISGVVGFIQVEFSLTSIQPGWAVSSLALTATLGMMLSAPLSDRVGRRPVLFDFPAAAFLVTPFMRPPPGDKGSLPRRTASDARSGLT